jgi:hypothetical protein
MNASDNNIVVKLSISNGPSRVVRCVWAPAPVFAYLLTEKIWIVGVRTPYI